MYTGLQIVSVNAPSIDPKELITEYDQMLPQKIPVETGDPKFGSTLFL